MLARVTVNPEHLVAFLEAVAAVDAFNARFAAPTGSAQRGFQTEAMATFSPEVDAAATLLETHTAAFSNSGFQLELVNATSPLQQHFVRLEIHVVDLTQAAAYLDGAATVAGLHIEPLRQLGVGAAFSCWVQLQPKLVLAPEARSQHEIAEAKALTNALRKLGLANELPVRTLAGMVDAALRGQLDIWTKAYQARILDDVRPGSLLSTAHSPWHHQNTGPKAVWDRATEALEFAHGFENAKNFANELTTRAAKHLVFAMSDVADLKANDELVSSEDWAGSLDQQLLTEAETVYPLMAMQLELFMPKVMDWVQKLGQGPTGPEL